MKYLSKKQHIIVSGIFRLALLTILLSTKAAALPFRSLAELIGGAAVFANDAQLDNQTCSSMSNQVVCLNGWDPIDAISEHESTGFLGELAPIQQSWTNFCPNMYSTSRHSHNMSYSEHLQSSMRRLKSGNPTTNSSNTTTTSSTTTPKIYSYLCSQHFTEITTCVSNGSNCHLNNGTCSSNYYNCSSDCEQYFTDNPSDMNSSRSLNPNGSYNYSNTYRCPPSNCIMSGSYCTENSITSGSCIIFFNNCTNDCTTGRYCTTTESACCIPAKFGTIDDGWSYGQCLDNVNCSIVGLYCSNAHAPRTGMLAMLAATLTVFRLSIGNIL